MNTTFINLNNVWTEILIVPSDTEKTFTSVIDDGDRRYYVTPYRNFVEDGKYYYWFIINSKEVVNAELKAQITELQSQLAATNEAVIALMGV